MTTQAFVRAASLGLAAALMSAGLLAQVQPSTRVDTAPAPAEERSSLGTLEVGPVLAKQRYLQELQRTAGPDTRAMGAGPAKVLRRHETGEALQLQRAMDAARARGGQPKAP